MAEKFSNAAKTTLAASINSTDTTITLTDGTNFPTTGTFRIMIGVEIIKISARSGNTLTVSQRGAESTVAASHSISAPVNHVLTAGSLQDSTIEYAHYGPYSSIPAASDCMLYVPSDTGGVYTSDGTSWYRQSMDYRFRAIDWTGFSWSNQGNATLTQRGPFWYLNATSAGTAPDNIRSYVKAVSAPFTATVCMTANFVGLSNGHFGLIVHSGTNTKKSTVGSSNNWGFGSLRIDGTGGISLNMSSTWNILPGNPYWYRVVVDATNFSMFMSTDGVNFVAGPVETLASHLVTVSHVGVGIGFGSHATTFTNMGVTIHEWTLT